MTKKIIFISFLALFFSVSAFSQAIPTSKLAWDQTAPALVDAQGYNYKYYSDGSSSANTFAGVTCSGTASPFQCEVAFPAFTPGNHTIQLTASNVAGESAKTSPFAFTFIVIPGSPTNVHIK